MPTNRYVCQRDQCVTAVTERPLPCTLAGEVTILHPAPVFLWMSAACPVPCQAPDLVVEFLENDLSDHVSVVVAPAPKDRVEGADQFRLRRMLSLLENRFDARAYVVDAGT